MNVFINSYIFYQCDKLIDSSKLKLITVSQLFESILPNNTDILDHDRDYVFILLYEKHIKFTEF